MPLPDLSEVGPDGERWWAIEVLDTIKGKLSVGSCLYFTSLDDVCVRIREGNTFYDQYDLEYKLIAFLADSRPLLYPYVCYAGRSVWQDSEDDIAPDDEDDIINDEDPF